MFPWSRPLPPALACFSYFCNDPWTFREGKLIWMSHLRWNLHSISLLVWWPTVALGINAHLLQKGGELLWSTLTQYMEIIVLSLTWQIKLTLQTERSFFLRENVANQLLWTLRSHPSQQNYLLLSEVVYQIYFTILWSFPQKLVNSAILFNCV